MTPAGLGIVLMLLPLVAAHGAWAGAPSDQLRVGVDRVLKILSEPEPRGEAQVLQRRMALDKVAGDIFDFGDMAKRALWQHWERRTPAERREFVRLFTGLIQRTYVSKVDQPAAAAMIFRGETLDAGHAVVQTTIPFSNGGKLPLDYWMHRPRDRWLVYDLNIDGVSLVANYRAQFNHVIRASSYDALLKRLKAQQAESSAPSASPSGIGVTR